jgi:ABC-type phosphate transport system substrate-binding protein
MSVTRKFLKKLVSSLGRAAIPQDHQNEEHSFGYIVCEYMQMTDSQIAKLARKKLTQAQQTALKIVENAKNGKYSGSERLARHVFNREEGKPTEYLAVGGNEDTLSDDECEEIRELMKRSFEK